MIDSYTVLLEDLFSKIKDARYALPRFTGDPDMDRCLERCGQFLSFAYDYAEEALQKVRR